MVPVVPGAETSPGPRPRSCALQECPGLSPCALSPPQDIPCRLLAQHKSQLELEQYLTGRKEKQQQLQKALEDLQLKLQELKFRQPPDPTRYCCLRTVMANGPPASGAGGHQQGSPSFVSLQLPPLLHWEAF